MVTVNPTNLVDSEITMSVFITSKHSMVSHQLMSPAKEQLASVGHVDLGDILGKGIVYDVYPCGQASGLLHACLAEY